MDLLQVHIGIKKQLDFSILIPFCYFVYLELRLQKFELKGRNLVWIFIAFYSSYDNRSIEPIDHLIHHYVASHNHLKCPPNLFPPKLFPLLPLQVGPTKEKVNVNQIISVYYGVLTYLEEEHRKLLSQSRSCRYPPWL